jgi:hypothetical protein
MNKLLSKYNLSSSTSIIAQFRPNYKIVMQQDATRDKDLEKIH